MPTIDGISKGCNLAYSYDTDNNTLRIYTMDYLANAYAKSIPESAEIAEQEDVEAYKNKKAILYDMIVVKNASGKYGVKNSSNNTIIGEKYKSISFEEEEEEFIVYIFNVLLSLLYEYAKLHPLLIPSIVVYILLLDINTGSSISKYS